MARSKVILGDARRDERAEWMSEGIVATDSLVLRKISGTRTGEIGAHRLLSSEVFSRLDHGVCMLPDVIDE